MDKIRKAIFMFVDLFGLERYSFEKLVRISQYFILVCMIFEGKIPGDSENQLQNSGLSQLGTWLPCVQQYLQHPEGLPWNIHSL